MTFDLDWVEPELEELYQLGFQTELSLDQKAEAYLLALLINSDTWADGELKDSHNQILAKAMKSIASKL